MLKVCFSLLAALLLTTIGILINTKVYKEVQGIDVAGRDIGISASSGAPFLALTCTTSVLMSLVNIFLPTGTRTTHLKLFFYVSSWFHIISSSLHVVNFFCGDQ